MQQTQRKYHLYKIAVINIIIAINKKVNEGRHIIITIDGNEPITNASGGIAKICRECKIFDPLDHKYGHTSDSKLYLRGFHRINFMFCSLVILTTVLRCDMTRFNDVITSDHCGLLIDLTRDVILKGKNYIHPRDSPGLGGTLLVGL